MDNSLISIVVPVYNVEKYLKECVDSLINQTYANIEILLIDDGATDSCPQICDEYAQKDERIKVIHKENGGLSDARNCGIDVAEGKYITFVDSDDYITLDFVEKLYNAIINNNVKMAQCNVVKVKDNYEEIEKIGYQENYLIKSGYDMIKDIYIGHWESIIACGKLYYIELFDDIRFPKGKIHEDEFTTYKILYKVENVAIVNEYLYKYRQNDKSITGQQFNLKRLNILEAYEERLNFFGEKKENELYEMSLNAYLGTIRICYVKTRKYIEHSQDIQKDLIKKYRKNYKEILTTKYISNLNKIKAIIFFISPKLHYKLKS